MKMITITHHGITEKQKEYRVEQDCAMQFVAHYDSSHVYQPIVLRFILESNAMLECAFLIDRCSVDVKIEVVLNGEGATAKINGAYILNQSNVALVETTQHHRAPHTRTELMVKGGLKDRGAAEYRGTITIDKNAQGSYASQENKNMILGRDARVTSVPNLQVLTDDVRCFHGSAVGRIDDELLFYLCARGIGESQARHLLLKAFFSGIFKDERLQQNLDCSIEELFFNISSMSKVIPDIWVTSKLGL